MKPVHTWIFFIYLIFLSSLNAKADFMFGFNSGLTKNSNSMSNANSSETNYYDVYIYSKLFKSLPLYLGIEYVYNSAATSNSSNSSDLLVSTNIYAGLKYYLGAKELLSAAILGNPNLKANYTASNSSTENWTGAGYGFKLALEPQITHRARVYAGVSYFAENYTSKNQSSSAGNISSFFRTSLVSEFGIQFKF